MFSHFSRTPTCDRQTDSLIDRHMAMAYRAYREEHSSRGKNEFVGGQHCTAPFSMRPTPILDQEVVKIHININNPTSSLTARESPKFARVTGNGIEEHDDNDTF